MSRSYVKQDIYVNDRLAFTGAQVIDYGEPKKQVIVRAHPQDSVRRLNMATVLVLTDTGKPLVADADTGTVRTWVGTVDGETVTLAAVGRSDRCLPCGARR